MIKFIFGLLGYEKKRPIHNLEFQRFILRALKEMTVRELAILVKTSLPTIQRWASGQSYPHPYLHSSIIKIIEPEMLKREEAIHNMYFGGKDK